VIGAQECFQRAHRDNGAMPDFPSGQKSGGDVFLDGARRNAQHPRCLSHVNGKFFVSASHARRLRQSRAMREARIKHMAPIPIYAGGYFRRSLSSRMLRFSCLPIGKSPLTSLTDSAAWLSNGSPNLHCRDVRIFGASRDWSRLFSVTPNPSSQRKTNSAKSSRLRDRVRSLGLPGTIPSLFAIFPQDSPSTCFARETLHAVAIHLGLCSSLGRPRRFDGRLNTAFR
jgi:hypothetical protein